MAKKFLVGLFTALIHLFVFGIKIFFAMMIGAGEYNSAKQQAFNRAVRNDHPAPSSVDPEDCDFI